MPATRDGKMWRSQFYYKDWQGVSHKKNKRGFGCTSMAECSYEKGIFADLSENRKQSVICYF